MCLVAGFLIFLGLSFYYLYNSPVVGASFSWDDSEQHYQVASSEPWSPLHTGDTVTAIGDLQISFPHLLTDNIHLHSKNELFSWLDAKQQIFRVLNQQSVAFCVIRNGKETEVRLTPRKAKMSFVSNWVFLHVIAGIVFFLIGLILFYQKEAGEESSIFLAMSLLIMLVFISNATSLMAEIVYQPCYLRLMNLANIVSLPLGNAVLFHLSLYLPHRKRLITRFPRLILFFYAVCIAIVVSLYIGTINFLVGLLATMTLAAVIHGYLAYRSPLERQQMKWVFTGFLFGLGPWVLLNGIPLLITGRRLVDDTITGVCVAFIPLSMALAIRKYRLMGIDAFLEGTFVYAVTILLLFVADLGIFSLIGIRFDNHDPINNMFFHPILIIALYVVFRDQIRRILRKVFKRIPLSEADTIAMLNSRAAGREAEEILHALGHVVKEAFRLETFLMIGKGAPGAGALFPYFYDRTEVINLWENPRLSRLTAQGFYMALVVATGDKKETHTLFLLGAVSGKYFYSRRDLAVLNALLVQVQTLHENAVLHEKMITEYNTRLMEERRHAREKEIMLKDLHDGIGGITANIHLLSEMARENPSFADAKSALSTVSALSKEGLSEINSFLLSLDPEEATYETLIAEFQHSSNTLIALHEIHFHLQNHGGELTDFPIARMSKALKGF
ncbi:hypothetical protein [Desulfobacterium sp. N47]|uniref:hypothetical protein n=1 Tax=Desulfobacterium sp. N47 TaxID=3115210 RepID=UPI003CAB6AB8